MIRNRICGNCGKKFSYEIGPGKDRKYCNDKCRLENQLKLRFERFEKLPKCKVSDCQNKATRISYGLCESCYYRLRRNGNTDRRKISGRYVTGAGYIKILTPGHPMASKEGHAYEHRIKLYEKYGSGNQECFWCGVMLKWEKIIGDHIDENKQNNDPGNLVISCNSCNRARGAMLPFIARMKVDRIDNLIEAIKKYNNSYQTAKEGAWGK